MAEEVRADYLELTQLAGTVLTAADELTGNMQIALGCDLSSPAFGNCMGNGGAELHRAQHSTAVEGGTVLQRLVSVLENDVDRIYRVAFAYREADLESAEELDRQAPLGGQQR